MPARCPACGELAYRHPVRRRRRLCPLLPAQAFAFDAELRGIMRPWANGLVDDEPTTAALREFRARLVAAAPGLRPPL